MIMELFTTSKRARWAYDRRMDWHFIDRAEGKAEGAVETARRMKHTESPLS